MIPVRNIYHMLTYVFKELRKSTYQHMDMESFENPEQLCAGILALCVPQQLKRGLERGYIECCEPLSGIRGRINLTETIKTQTTKRRQLACNFDDFSICTLHNQILKTTLELLIQADLGKDLRCQLQRLLPYFASVDSLTAHEIARINWNMTYNRNNQNYELQMGICRLVLEGLLHTPLNGKSKQWSFSDIQEEWRLYQKFILRYFKRHFPQLNASSPHIKWALGSGTPRLLPNMETDIVLSDENTVLIIEAKYRNPNLNDRYGTPKLFSSHLYQIFAYVKNYESRDEQNICGMLFYAQTDDAEQPSGSYIMSGSKIDVRTLDLSCEFTEIARQLDEIANEYFGLER